MINFSIGIDDRLTLMNGVTGLTDLAKVLVVGCL